MSARKDGHPRILPSLDFAKPHGHEGEHLPVQNPTQSMTPEDAPVPHAHMDDQ